MSVTDALLALELDPKDEIESRLKAEKAAVIKAVASARFDTIQQRVAWILNHFPDTRNSDIALQLKYWERFEPELYDGSAIEPKTMYRLTGLTSLQRARAKIQSTYGLFQASPDVRRRRGQLSEEAREKAAAQQPDHPTFTVYADESGKTQEHLVVGNIWFPNAAELGSLTLATQRLKSQHGFKGELHFKQINANKVPVYNELADLVGRTANTFSFKAVSVERRGIGNVSNGLRDLYYLLLLEGVKHEVKSSRATLPRKLQLLKDAEESGSDKLLLQWLKDRLVGAAKSHFDGLLQPDVFEIEDSRLSEVLQVADLFTSAIGRRLNARSAKKSPKYEFAEHFVRSIGFATSTVKDEARGDVVFHLILARPPAPPVGFRGLHDALLPPCPRRTGYPAPVSREKATRSYPGRSSSSRSKDGAWRPHLIAARRRAKTAATETGAETATATPNPSSNTYKEAPATAARA